LETIERIDPDFDKIIPLCLKELDIKFSEYGNTWLESDDLYYKERMLKEVQEYVESMTIQSEQRKLLNIINIAAMAYQTAPVNRGCRNHKPIFEDIMASKDTTFVSVCTICKKTLMIRNGIIESSDI